MAHTPHELTDEFPEFVSLMRRLRETDSHYVNLSDQYHTLNRALHRAETNVEPTTDDHLVEMRKERMLLKDTIYGYLKSHNS